MLTFPQISYEITPSLLLSSYDQYQYGAFRILPPSSHCWEVNSKQQALWKILMTSWNDKLWHFRLAALIRAQDTVGLNGMLQNRRFTEEKLKWQLWMASGKGRSTASIAASISPIAPIAPLRDLFPPHVTRISRQKATLQPSNNNGITFQCRIVCFHYFFFISIDNIALVVTQSCHTLVHQHRCWPAAGKSH